MISGRKSDTNNHGAALRAANQKLRLDYDYFD